jgi:hypothetical protein
MREWLPFHHSPILDASTSGPCRRTLCREGTGAACSFDGSDANTVSVAAVECVQQLLWILVRQASEPGTRGIEVVPSHEHLQQIASLAVELSMLKVFNRVRK